jgi:uncharacterized protein YfaP (DUF2135 family)
MLHAAIWVVCATLAWAAPARQSGKILGAGTEKPKITLKSPTGGWTVDRMVLVEGTISDPTITPITININGDRYLLKNHNGEFKRKFPLSSGKNTIVVSGENAGGTGKAERVLFAKVPALPMNLVLTSDTDGVYTDLHVYEPTEANFTEPKKFEHVYWARTESPSGGRFYLNEQGGSFDEPGYGPYLYTHSSPPKGIYRIDANYWPSGDKAHTVATLNLTLFGGTNNEQKKLVKAPLVTPGETVTLAWIRYEGSGRASVYAPLVDSKPKDGSVWPKWVLDFNPRQKNIPNGGDYAE